MANWLCKYASWVERGAGWILAGLLLTTAFLAWQLPGLKIFNDLQTFYPDDALTRTYRTIEETFGGDKFPRTAYLRFTPRANESVTSPAAVLEMETVLQTMRAVPGVVSAQGLPDLVKLIVSGLHGGLRAGDPTANELPEEGEMGYSFAQLIQLTTQRLSSVQDYVSPRGTALVVVRIGTDADLLQVASEIENVLTPVSNAAKVTHIELLGYGNSLREFNEATVADVRLLLPLAASLMAIVLLWAFRLSLTSWFTIAALIAVVSAWSLDGILSSNWQLAVLFLAFGFGLSAFGMQLWLRNRSSGTWVKTMVVLCMASLVLGASLSWTFALGLIVLAIIFLSFRQLSEVYLPLLVVGIASIWTFGLMALTGVALSFLMIAVLPLLLGVGLDDALHLLHRYRQERHAGKAHARALRQALGNTGHALWLTTVTTVAGFAALLISTSPPVRAFGLLATFAMISAFCVTILLIPTVGNLLQHRHTRRTSSKVWRHITKQITRPRFAKGWLLVVGVVVVVAFVNGQALKVYPYDLRWMLPPESDQIRLYDEINAEFKNYDQVQLLFQGDVARLDVMRTLNQVLEPALSASPYVRGIRHIGRLLDDVRHANAEVEARFMEDFLTSPDLAYQNLLEHAWSQPVLTSRFQSMVHRTDSGIYDGAVVRINVLRAHAPEEVSAITADIERRIAAVETELAQMKLEMSLTGSPYLEALSLVALKEGFFYSMGLAFVLIGIVLTVAFRSLLWGVICLIPMGLVMVFELATIQGLGLHISASTALVAALSIGLGIDYTIHLTQRVRETGRIVVGFAQVSPTLLATSATTLAAFLTLVLGQIPWNKDFGILAGSAIVYALLVTLGVYPAILVAVRPWLRLKTGGIS